MNWYKIITSQIDPPASKDAGGALFLKMLRNGRDDDKMIDISTKIVNLLQKYNVKFWGQSKNSSSDIFALNFHAESLQLIYEKYNSILADIKRIEPSATLKDRI